MKTIPPLEISNYYNLGQLIRKSEKRRELLRKSLLRRLRAGERASERGYFTVQRIIRTTYPVDWELLYTFAAIKLYGKELTEKKKRFFRLESRRSRPQLDVRRKPKPRK